MQPSKIKIKYFYDDNALSDYENKAVMYVAYIGFYNGEHLFKFGLSRDVFSRDFIQHRKSFTKFNIIFIHECDNCEQVEDLFKHQLIAENLHRERTINGKSQTELFTFSKKKSHDTLVNELKRIIDNHPLPAIKEANNTISNLNNVVDVYRQTDKTRQLELKFKLSDNYKLELETKLKEFESIIEVRKLDIELQKEKNIQSAIENGADPNKFFGLVSNVTKNKNNRNAVIVL